MSEEVKIPTMGGFGNITSEEAEALIREITERYPDIRNSAGEYTVDHRRLRGIRNYNLAPDVRAAKAIVSPSGQATGGDFTDIQKATDYVHSEGGGSILMRAGTSTLDADFLPKDNVQIIGSGRGSSALSNTIIATNGYKFDFLNKGDGVRNFSISNLRIDGTLGGITPEGLLDVVGASQVEVARIYIDNVSFEGLGNVLKSCVKIDGASHVYVTRSYGEGTGYFVDIDNAASSLGSSDIHIKDNIIVTSKDIRVNEEVAGDTHSRILYENNTVTSATRLTTSGGVALIAKGNSDGIVSPSFEAVRTEVSSLASGGFSKIPFNIERADFGGNYNHTNGEFTAPYKMQMHFDASVSLLTISSGKIIIASLFVDGTEKKRGARMTTSASGTFDVGVSADLYLNAGEVVDMRVYHNGGLGITTEANAQGAYVYFNGHAL